MKIVVEIENNKDFDPQRLLKLLNQWFSDLNSISGGSNYWARYIGTIGEDDETD